MDTLVFFTFPQNFHLFFKGIFVNTTFDIMWLQLIMYIIMLTLLLCYFCYILNLQWLIATGMTLVCML